MVFSFNTLNVSACSPSFEGGVYSNSYPHSSIFKVLYFWTWILQSLHLFSYCLNIPSCVTLWWFLFSLFVLVFILLDVFCPSWICGLLFNYSKYFFFFLLLAFLFHTYYTFWYSPTVLGCSLLFMYLSLWIPVCDVSIDLLSSSLILSPAMRKLLLRASKAFLHLTVFLISSTSLWSCLRVSIFMLTLCICSCMFCFPLFSVLILVILISWSDSKICHIWVWFSCSLHILVF